MQFNTASQKVNNFRGMPFFIVSTHIVQSDFLVALAEQYSTVQYGGQSVQNFIALNI